MWEYQQGHHEKKNKDNVRRIMQQQEKSGNVTWKEQHINARKARQHEKNSATTREERAMQQHEKNNVLVWI
jgi:hypothetical protein